MIPTAMILAGLLHVVILGERDDFVRCWTADEWKATRSDTCLMDVRLIWSQDMTDPEREAFAAEQARKNARYEESRRDYRRLHPHRETRSETRPAPPLKT